MITRKNAKEWLPLVAALAEGKEIQHCFSNRGWDGVNAIDGYGQSPSMYRVAPETKKVPLTAEDIPAVCWVKLNDSIASFIVLSVGSEGIEITCDGLSFHELMTKGWQYSTDRKRWKPCWKEVAE